MKQKVILICSVCLSRNYSTTVSSSVLEKGSINKYCPKCNAYTEHKISK
ncbi:MAG: 50S ribosomal protein L33 [Coprobacillus sp.]|nr:50S ribosomal protein L33 [Coprobacillus sp.]